MSLLHMEQTLGRVGQWVRPVDDRRELPGLDEPSHGEQLLPVLPGWERAEPLRDERIGDDRPADAGNRPEHVAGRAAPVEHEGALRGERPAEPSERKAAHVVEDHVVLRPPVGEVLPRVVDDVRGTDRAHQLDIVRAAHPGDLGAERRRDLDGVRAHPAAGPVDEHLPTGLHPAYVADPAQGRRRRYGDRGRLIEGEARRLSYHHVSRRERVLRECTPAKPSTSSPFRSPRTFAPTASTTPAASTPATRAFGLLRPTSPMSRATRGSPRRMCQSAGLSAAACTRTSTSPAPTSGTSMSASRRTSGGPNRSWTIAFIKSPRVVTPGHGRC